MLRPTELDNLVIKKLEEAKVVRLFRKGTDSKPSVYLFPDLLIITG